MRKNSVYTALALLAGSLTIVESQDVKGQLAKLPVCAQACITHAFSICKCRILDFQCACASGAFRSTSQECSNTSCSGTIVQSSLTTIDEMCKAMELRLSSQSSSATSSSASSRSIATLSTSGSQSRSVITISNPTAGTNMPSRTALLSASVMLPTGSAIVKPQPSDGRNDASIIPSWGYASVVRSAATTGTPLSGSISATRLSGVSPTFSIPTTDPRFSRLRTTGKPTLTLTRPIPVPSTTSPWSHSVHCWPVVNATRNTNSPSYRSGTAVGDQILGYCSTSGKLSRSPAYATGTPLNRSATAGTRSTSMPLPYGTAGTRSVSVPPPYGTGSLNVTGTTTSAIAQYTGGAELRRAQEGERLVLCAWMVLVWAGT